MWLWIRLTAVEVYEKDPFQVFVVDQGSMDTWARLVVDGEVTPVRVPPEQVVLLFVYDQFLQGQSFSVTVIATSWRKKACKRSAASLCLWAITSTVTLPTAKLKYQGWCCSRTVLEASQPCNVPEWNTPGTRWAVGLVSGAFTDMSRAITCF